LPLRQFEGGGELRPLAKVLQTWAVPRIAEAVTGRRRESPTALPKAFFANNMTSPRTSLSLGALVPVTNAATGRIEVAIARYCGLFHVFWVVSAAWAGTTDRWSVRLLLVSLIYQIDIKLLP
jgi:hypothetical protein